MPEGEPAHWVHEEVSAGALAQLADGCGVDRVVAELLFRAGFLEAADAIRFLEPRLAELEDPFRLTNLGSAATRIREAIELKESIVILGDYDVDGVSSTALLVGILRAFGSSPRFVVPLRLEEGYGLSRGAIDRALEGGTPALFIALDCGTNAHDEVAYLRSLGVDVIIVDHHRSKEAAPDGAILINPHVLDSAAATPWTHLCTVGLVFKLAHGLLKQLRDAGDPRAFEIKLRDYLDFVVMGTVADLVPLRDENRILAKHGLSILRATARPGILALMEVSRLEPGGGIQPSDISFRLGPRINASGRLADASLSVELFLSRDVAFCREAAGQLEAFNKERQEIERRISEEAEQVVEEKHSGDSGIVLFGDDWHPGVVGIVASRVSRHFNRPAIVLGREGELAKGSGRGLFGINLVDVLAECSDLLTSWGGHPMAVGISMPAGNVAAFRERFNALVAARMGDGFGSRELKLSAWIELDQIGEPLMAALEQLQPFGQGNPEPVFAVRGIRLKRRPEIFNERHFRFTLENSMRQTIFGVAWKMARRLPPAGLPVDIAFKLVWNQFNGRRMLQMQVLDWRPSA